MQTEKEREEYRNALKAEVEAALENFAQLRSTSEGREQLNREAAEYRAKEKKSNAEFKALQKKRDKENKKSIRKRNQILSAPVRNNLWLLRLIIETGAKTDEIRFAAYLAIKDGRVEHLKYLYKKGADLDSYLIEGSSFFTYAVRNNHIDVARYLLSIDSDVNYLNQNGENVMSEIFSNGCPDFTIVLFLLSAGVDPNLRDRNGSPPLIRAVKEQKFNIVGMLVNGGANINVTDNMGMTPLMHATALKDFKTVEWLLKTGASINIQDKLGRSAVMHIGKYVSPSFKQQVDYAKSKGVDLNRSETYLNAKRMLNAAGIKFEDIPATKSIRIILPDAGTDIIMLFVKNGLNLNLKDNSGDTVGHILIKKDYDLYALLEEEEFSERLDFNAKGADGFTFFQLLLDHNRDPQDTIGLPK